MKKKLLSVLLALCLAMTLMPSTVFAEWSNTTETLNCKVGASVNENYYLKDGQMHPDKINLTSGSLPTGMYVTYGGLVGEPQLKGVPVPGTVGNHIVTFTDSQDSTTLVVTINVASGSQTIHVDDGANADVSAITIPLGANYTLNTYSEDASNNKIDIATDYPSLTAADHQPTYTYASSNTAVATVNSTTGVVSPVAKGTTNITINSAATSSYAAATGKIITLNVGYGVTNSLTNIATSGASAVALNTDYSATLTADSDYTLPAAITVTVGSTPLTVGENTYSYDSTSGALTVKAAAITDDLTITAVGVDTRHDITYKITGSYFTNDSFSTQANVPFGTPLSLISGDMTQAGYTFSGWSGLPATMPDNDVTVIGSYALNMTLDPAANKTFTAATVGYGAQTAHSVTVINENGSGATGDLTVALSGTNANSFTLSKTTISSIAASGSDSFTVVPNTGLAVGTYTATVTVDKAAGNTNSIIAQSFDVSFTVNRQPSSGDSTDYYTLTFNTNGGSAISSIRPSEYTTVDLSKYTPTRDGYTFRGWYSDKELTTKITSIRLTKNTTIYAGWKLTHENPQTGVWENPFSDVSKTDWFYESVALANTLGLMNGTSATTFSPNAATTRGMIVSILWRLENEPAVTVANPFTDVASGKYYHDAVIWAAENNIVGGYGGGLFGPEDAITREQLATILYNYAKFKGYDVSVGEDTNILSYNDAFDISEYAIPAMQWACGAGIIQGDGENLMPKDGATRAQAAAILIRFMNAVDK